MGCPTDSSLQTSLNVHVMFILYAFVVYTVIDVIDLKFLSAGETVNADKEKSAYFNICASTRCFLFYVQYKLKLCCSAGCECSVLTES